MKLLSNRKIVVIGDIMLDEYWYGTTNRISPEAPVPVVDDIHVSHVLGGATNVALTSRVFCDDLTVYGCAGYDQASIIITRKLAENKIKYSFSYSYENKTISKIRIMSDNHQLVRVDHGNIAYPQSTVIENDPDVIIVSDYNKGTLCDEYLEYLMDFSCPVIVDPKGTNWEKYSGAYCLTPNKKEFEEAYGEFSIELAKGVVNDLQMEGILVTLGAEGMVWVDKDGQSIWLESDAKEVFDVTGAGDTVIATFASFLHEGVRPAMIKANRAAGIVVGKVGTSVPTKKDVIEKVVFTNGCFDIIHSGHIALLKASAKLGDRLVVGLNSDESVERIKRKPINDAEERKAVLESIEGVDEVIIFDEDTPYELIKTLIPDVIVKGGDYTVHNVVGADIVDEVVIFPTLEGKSTTKIIERVKNVH
jgi:D-beta-D-heptose 7-phosphate kinase/D-beta-D-heptose 1-phosphate adenosyltransferase